MQRIDYWVGVPLCAILSLFDLCFGGLFFSKRDNRKLLFIELSEIGSSVLAYSALKRAAEKYGAANIYFLIFEKNKEAIELSNVVPTQNVFTLDDSNLFAFSLSAVRTLLQIRKLAPEATVDLELFSRFTAIFSFLTGAVKRVGFHQYTAEGLYRGRLINHPVFYNPHQHMVRNFLALVEAVDTDLSDVPLLKRSLAELELPPPGIVFTEDEIAWARGMLPQGKILFLNPDPGQLTIRGWPVDRFAEVALSLVDELDLTVVLLGLPSSAPFVRVISEAFSERGAEGRLLSLVGKTKTLRELAAVLECGDVLLTCDSGAGHLASYTGVSPVVLFGPETPRLYSPQGERVRTVWRQLSCSPCVSAFNHRHTACNNNLCLQQLTVEEVTQVVREAFLARAGGVGRLFAEKGTIPC